MEDQEKGQDSPRSLSHLDHQEIEQEPKQSSLSRSDDRQNTVDWDGADDPENPLNWPTSTKALQLVFMALNTFLTPLASSMFAPGVTEVLHQFGSTSSTLASFMVSVYLLGYMVGPFFIAPMSELYGRVPVYHTCNVLFLIFTVACAVSQTLPQLIIFRLLAGCAGACPLTIGSGTAADLITKEKRAGIMAIWGLGPILGPVVGPVAGGFLVQAKGWRWVFWVLAIATGVMIIGSFMAYRESYAPVLLRRKASRLRQQSGNEHLRSVYEDDRPPRQVFITALARPARLLFGSPIVLSMALFTAINYGYLYLIFTTLPSIFESDYGFSQGLSGLAYIGFGLGYMIGLIIFGRIADHIATEHSRRGCFTPESRLPPMVWGCWGVPVGLLWYGWSVYAHAPWIVPILGTGVFGIGMMSVTMSVNIYLVDSYLTFAASVTAASMALRSLVGAFLPLAGPSMYETLGIGWGNSLLAFISLALCVIPIVFTRYGVIIRTHPRFQMKL